MVINGVSFSYAENSLQTRGLKLVDYYLKFQNIFAMKDFDLPVCYSNKPDGIVPENVHKIDQVFASSDILVFAISEAGGQYCAAFKNIMDWLIVKNKFNSQLGKGYSLSKKSIYVLTFTPTNKNSGHRHFEMTKQILEQKFGAIVQKMYVFNRSWEGILPKNYFFVERQCEEIIKNIKNVTQSNKNNEDAVSLNLNALEWINQYEEWDKKWTAL